MSGSLLIVQAGGPTAVFNASLAAAVREARAQGLYTALLGARSGFAGLVAGDYCSLDMLDEQALDLLMQSPGAVLGSSRFKPGSEDFERMLTHLDRHGVRSLLFLGGNGTMSGAAACSRALRAAGYEAQVVCAPKTIDNDIASTDRSPGFASAARYVAQSVRDLAMDVRALPQPVSIVETLGRDVGWLAAAAVLGKRNDADAPHLVYVPERPFVTERFLADLDRALHRHGWAVVVVAEGVRDAQGNPVYQSAGAARADAQRRPLIGGVAEHLAGVAAAALGVRCRSEKPGLLGRCCRAMVAPQDLRDAVLAGRAAVQALAAGADQQTVVLLPLHSEEATALVPLAEAAGVTRQLPERFLVDGPLSVNGEFVRYAAPLAGELAAYFDSTMLSQLERKGAADAIAW